MRTELDSRGVRGSLERVRRVREEGKEPEVVEKGSGAEKKKRRAAQCGEAGPKRSLPWCGSWLRQKNDDRDKADRHEDSGSEKRHAPRDRAKGAAGERSHRHAHAERSLVKDDGLTGAARGSPDDRRESCGNEQGVAEPPAGTEADDRVDATRCSRERCEQHDEDESRDESAFHAEPARDEPAEEHRDRGDDQVARKQEHRLRGTCMKLTTDRRKNRVNEPDPHERHHACEGNRPHGHRLVKDGRCVFGFGSRGAISWRRRRFCDLGGGNGHSNGSPI